MFLFSSQNRIEDIRLDQEKEAEKLIRLYFQMEQIVYCQDQVYRVVLQNVREREAEEEKKKYTFSVLPSKDISMAEILQHLKAYHQVSV